MEGMPSHFTSSHQFHLIELVIALQMGVSWSILPSHLFDRLAGCHRRWQCRVDKKNKLVASCLCHQRWQCRDDKKNNNNSKMMDMDWTNVERSALARSEASDNVVVE